MKCPYCDNKKTRVIDTSHDTRGGTRRRRVCDNCRERFSSYERPILATPMLVKQDGTREEFSRDKLMAGIKVACAKRPVAAEDIERIAGEVEAELQQLGKAEVKSHVAGDRVIKKLKNLDEVAYIRYATVYLGFDDLESIRKEIDRLLEAR
ncbi:MAG: transcriptional repressor NrdR [Chloroflexi bacterium]|nr:transcriptional repressor NrdR [Chloroflexota bacterium]